MRPVTNLAALLAAQRRDGSWGRSEDAAARIVPTIFAARSLQESDATSGKANLENAVTFLADVAVVDGGGSIHGTRDSGKPRIEHAYRPELVARGRHSETITRRAEALLLPPQA